MPAPGSQTSRASLVAGASSSPTSFPRSSSRLGSVASIAMSARVSGEPSTTPPLQLELLVLLRELVEDLREAGRIAERQRDRGRPDELLGDRARTSEPSAARRSTAFLSTRYSYVAVALLRTRRRSLFSDSTARPR